MSEDVEAKVCKATKQNVRMKMAMLKVYCTG